MLGSLKHLVKKLVSHIPLDYFIRASHYAMFNQDFAESLKVTTFKT